MSPTLSAVVIARDEAEMIDRCVARLRFADEVLVVLDDRTTDDTRRRAEQAGARVVDAHFDSFAGLRNHALHAATQEWVLFVDADERVTSALAAEIRTAISADVPAYRVPVRNWFYGSPIRASGYRERPVRLFRREGASFEGDIHERLVLDAQTPAPTLRTPLEHFSHRSVLHNLAKTSAYADVQARQMLAEGHRRVTAWSLVAIAVRTLGRHLVVGRGFRDGAPGVIESFYQAFSIFCVHVRLWELQRVPSIEQRYEDLEQRLR